MSDDYNKKVASSELAKLGIVETKKEDTPKQTTINDNQCEVCEGKGYVNLSDTDNVDSRVDCDDCHGSGLPLSQEEKDYMAKEQRPMIDEQQMSLLEDELDDELPGCVSTAKTKQTDDLVHVNLEEKFASLEPDNSDQYTTVTTGTHNQWSKDSVAEKLEELKNNYKVQEGECSIEPKDMSKIVDLLKTNFGDLVEHAGFVYKTSHAHKIMGDLIEDFIIKETTHNHNGNYNKIVVDRND